MSTFTKGQLIEEVNYNLEHCYCSEKTKRLMEIALASLEAEAVAYMTYKGYLLHAADPKLAEYSEPTPLYDAPTAPVSVPDEMDLLTCHLDGVTETYAKGWNACRAAMLNQEKSNG